MGKILLLLDHPSNRRLLKAFIKGRHELETPEAVPACLETPFDLCILDGPALDRLENAVRAAKERAAPLFLPFLLITSREQVGLATRHLWRTVDDILLAPIEKIELQARIEILLTARRLSLELRERERFATISKIASGVAHELRNPLGVIHNVAYHLEQILPQVPQMAPEHVHIREHLDILEQETQIAVNIISNLLYHTTASRPDPQPVSVSRLVNRLLERFPAPASIRVTLDLPPDLPPLHADPAHIEQALANLLLNAYEAMPLGGELSVIGHQSSVTDNSLTTEHCLLITVRDSGPGIPPENLSKLFTPLFTTKPHGIGLGLAVAKKLVEVNGGRLEVESEAGKGAAFTIALSAGEESPRP